MRACRFARRSPSRTRIAAWAAAAARAEPIEPTSGINDEFSSFLDELVGGSSTTDETAAEIEAREANAEYKRLMAEAKAAEAAAAAARARMREAAAAAQAAAAGGAPAPKQAAPKRPAPKPPPAARPAVAKPTSRGGTGRASGRGRGRGSTSGSSSSASAAAAAAVAAAVADVPEPPPVSRVISDGERVRREAEVINDGVYERCGTFGCILENKHPGLHVFAMASSRRGAARPVRDQAREARLVSTSMHCVCVCDCVCVRENIYFV